MRLLLFCVTCVISVATTVCGHPAGSESLSVEEIAERYAAFHPNLDPENIEECQELVVEAEKDGNDPLNAITDPDLMWPDNTIYYTIERRGYTDEQLELIEAGISDLQNLTQVDGSACIYIIPRTLPSQIDYVSVENYDGCSSYVGRIGGEQRLSLVDSCVTRHGTIMHEFLHAFGFYHEQERTDRDDYVIINWSNIEPGKWHNFEKLDESECDLLGTAYDYGSVMHYDEYAFAVNDSIPTIIPLDPDADPGQRETLSDLDIERVQILYGCLDPAKSVYFKDKNVKSLW